MKISLETSCHEKLSCEITYPELIYGATAVVVPFPIQGEIIHPLTGEKLPVILQLSSIKTAYFLIPAHIQKHFLIAQQNNIPIKQVVAPLYQGTGNQAIHPDLPIQTRKSIIAVIKHWTEDSYLCVDSIHRDCKSFVLGGRENDESPSAASIRETIEETGYTDIIIDNVYPIKLLNHFYADYKRVNRHATLHIVFGHLNSSQQTEISTKESNEHTVKWIEKSKLHEFISVKNNLFAVDIIQNGPHAYEGDGLIINSNTINGLTRTKAQILATQLLTQKQGEKSCK